MNVGSFQIFQQSGVYKIGYLTSQLKIVYHVLIWINIHMGTLQTDVNGFNNRSLQFDGNFWGVYSKSPNSGDANSGHLRIGHIFLERQELMQNLIWKPLNSGHLCAQQLWHMLLDVTFSNKLIPSFKSWLPSIQVKYGAHFSL